MPEPRRVLHLHGFASSPKSRKVALLRDSLRPDGFSIDAPDLNVPSFSKLSFAAMADVARAAARRTNPSLITGSSLGALVALAIAGDFAVPLVLIAPAIGFGERWIENLRPGDPLRFFHHAEGRELPIHRAFFEEMARLDVDRDPPANPVSLIMGEKDESVPFSLVSDVWSRWLATGRVARGSKFVPVPGGDHGLTEHVDAIAAEIRRLASSSS